LRGVNYAVSQGFEFGALFGGNVADEQDEFPLKTRSAQRLGKMLNLLSTISHRHSDNGRFCRRRHETSPNHPIVYVETDDYLKLQSRGTLSAIPS
jgi:hypothetical protein